MFALWTAVTLCRPLATRVVEGVAGDPLGRRPGDDLDALGGVGPDHVLDPGVQVLGVLADDHEVDVLVARVEALHRAGRADVGVQPEGLAEGDVDAPEALPDRRRDGSLQGDLVAPDRLEDVVRERRPELGHDALAGVDDVPLEGDPGRLEDRSGGRRDLRPDAVPGDEGDTVGHARIAQERPLPRGAGPAGRVLRSGRVARYDGSVPSPTPTRARGRSRPSPRRPADAAQASGSASRPTRSEREDPGSRRQVPPRDPGPARPGVGGRPDAGRGARGRANGPSRSARTRSSSRPRCSSAAAARPAA